MPTSLVRLFLPAIIGSLAMFSQDARASEWGCKVLLCLSSPEGPKQKECKPPLEKLWKHLRDGGSMPSCDEDKSSSLKRVFGNPYPVCPKGLTETTGWVAIVGGKEWNAAGPVEYPSSGDSGGTDTAYRPKACVGRLVKSRSVPLQCSGVGGGDMGYADTCTGGYTVREYDQVEPLEATGNRRAVEIYRNGAIQDRVFY